MRIRLLATTATLALLVPASTALAGGTTTGADLQVSGSSNLGSPVQGQPYYYTFQVKNSGPQDATGVTFSDDLAGVSFAFGSVNGFSSVCSHTSDGSGGTAISCDLGTLVKGGQTTVQVNLNAPQTIGSFANTGSATSAVTDPQPSNNSAIVTVKVGSAACPLPAGQPTISGVVAWEAFNSIGQIAYFHMYGNDGVQYTVMTNLSDASQPLTSVINLLCKTVPGAYIQVGNTDSVTGTVDMEVLPGDTVATPVIHASVVQTPYWVDKVA
jgi:uncharacterized repeat protein (TIGR01451 family)